LELECFVRAHQVLGSNLAHARILMHGHTHGQRSRERLLEPRGFDAGFVVEASTASVLNVPIVVSAKALS
jgi:hypothetical protein